MKYVAKVDSDNFLVSITKEELLTLVFGDERPEYNEEIKKDVRSFLDNLNQGLIQDIPFSEKFKRIISFYHVAKDFGGWRSFTSQMEEIKNLFVPVKEYIEKFKDVK